MKFTIITVGKNMPDWVRSGYQEYAQRFHQNLDLSIKEITPIKRPKNGNIAQTIHQEGQQICSLLQPKSFVVALDIRGKCWSTEELAANIQHWQQQTQHVCFLIGGPDGLSTECLERADAIWSLSLLTFPHPMVRVILAEQLYRAWSILQQHPYHRGNNST